MLKQDYISLLHHIYIHYLILFYLV